MVTDIRYLTGDFISDRLAKKINEIADTENLEVHNVDLLATTTYPIDKGNKLAIAHLFRATLSEKSVFTNGAKMLYVTEVYNVDNPTTVLSSLLPVTSMKDVQISDVNTLADYQKMIDSSLNHIKE